MEQPAEKKPTALKLKAPAKPKTPRTPKTPKAPKEPAVPKVAKPRKPYVRKPKITKGKGKEFKSEELATASEDRLPSPTHQHPAAVLSQVVTGFHFNFDEENDLERRVLRKEQVAKLGISSMKRLQTSMQQYGKAFAECAGWVDQMQMIIDLGKLPRFLIGVLGYTGSGKSSLINALIEEELVLSCNAMRASTAVAVEISWNPSDSPDQAYTAEIEFVTAAEWDSEFTILSGDITSRPAGERLDSNSGTDAGMAYAKLEAVYPGIPVKKLLDMSNKERLKARDLSTILGKTVTIHASSPKEFHEAVNGYIDSTNGGADDDEPAHWPLVRVVRIMMKANILKTGLVLVDLPGLGDANVGRTQVAENYVKNVKHMWVVADIVRAVDDGVAKDLMGRGFKRQLLMDGRYNDDFVTFIMTKTDQLNTQEVINTLKMDKTCPQMKDALENESKLREALEENDRQVREKQQQQRDHRKCLSALIEEGKPTESSESSPSRKRKSPEDDSLPEVDIPEERKSLFEQLQGATEAEKDLRKKSTELKKSINALKVLMKTICIVERNQWTQDKMASDFRNGLAEFEEELVESAEVGEPILSSNANSLKGTLATFSVSSKAYQKLKGRFKRDNAIKGFPTIEHTQIPRLQDFGRKCTLRPREAIADKIRNEVMLLNVSFRSWAENPASSRGLADKQVLELKEAVKSHYEELKETTTKAAKLTLNNIQYHIRTHIENNLNKTVIDGAKKAPELSKEIATRDIAPQTWKAICRRQGASYCSGKKVTYHLNEEFLGVFLAPIARPWDATFRKKIPALHATYSAAVIQALKGFKDAADASITNICGAYPGMQMVLEQLPYLEEQVQETVLEALMAGQNHAQDAHRTVGGAVRDNMKPCFDTCNQESGTGSISRIKQHIVDHMTKDAANMFQAASVEVVTSLKAMVKEIMENLARATKKSQDKLFKDIMGTVTIIGKDKNTAFKANVERNKLRQLIMAELARLEESWEHEREAFKVQIKLETKEVTVKKEEPAAVHEDLDGDSSGGSSLSKLGTGTDEDGEDDDGDDADEEEL